MLAVNLMDEPAEMVRQVAEKDRTPFPTLLQGGSVGGDDYHVVASPTTFSSTVMGSSSAPILASNRARSGPSKVRPRSFSAAGAVQFTNEISSRCRRGRRKTPIALRFDVWTEGLRDSTRFFYFQICHQLADNVGRE